MTTEKLVSRPISKNHKNDPNKKKGKDNSQGDQAGSACDNMQSWKREAPSVPHKVRLALIGAGYQGDSKILSPMHTVYDT